MADAGRDAPPTAEAVSDTMLKTLILCLGVAKNRGAQKKQEKYSQSYAKRCISSLVPCIGDKTNKEKIVILKRIGRIVIPICAFLFTFVYGVIGLTVPPYMIGE